MVLKYIRDAIVKELNIEFPPPCGDVILKYRDENGIPDQYEERFPSPCGDMVLK